MKNEVAGQWGYKSFNLVMLFCLGLLLASCSSVATPDKEVTLNSLAAIKTHEFISFFDTARAFGFTDTAARSLAAFGAEIEMKGFEANTGRKCFFAVTITSSRLILDNNIGSDYWEAYATTKAKCTSVSVFHPLIFNWQWYLAANQDLRSAGIDTAAEAQQHWFTSGLAEGREGSAAFMGRVYVNRYADLKNFADWENAYRNIYAAAHYVAGFNEPTEGYRRAGRIDMVDSRVFDAANYLSRYNAEFRGAGISTQLQAKRHWLETGIYEGRQGNASFNSQTYLSLHADLQAAFTGAMRFARAAQHYLEFGIGENRRIR